jgi:hypothetical protein
VQVIALLALNDAGAPSYDRDNEARFAAIGIPCFACTPDLFPDLMAAVIQRRSLGGVDFAGWHRGSLILGSAVSIVRGLKTAVFDATVIP